MKKGILVIAISVCASPLFAQKIPAWKIDDVVNFFNKNNDTVYVVNFWSTWCIPCLEELPYIQKICKKYETQKVKLLLVSIDTKKVYETSLPKVIKARKITAPVVWLNETDADIFCPKVDSGWSGSLPATVIVNQKAGHKYFLEGKFSEKQFQYALNDAMAVAIRAASGDSKKAISYSTYRYISPCAEATIKDRDDYRKDYGMQTDITSFFSADSLVYSIESGVVSFIAQIDTGISAIMLRKGNLIYTYSNLSRVLFRKGDVIEANQLIGYAALDLDQKYRQVDFILSNERREIPLSKENFTQRKR